MQNRLDRLLGAIEAILALHKDLISAFDAHHKLVDTEYREIQRRTTVLLVCSAIAAAAGVISLLLQLLQLLSA